MIIGNSNNGNNFNNKINDKQIKESNIFNRKMNQIKDNNENTTYKNPFVEDLNSMQHSNPTDKTNMRDKSLAMLQERLDKGIISQEDFNNKVSKINENK